MERIGDYVPPETGKSSYSTGPPPRLTSGRGAVSCCPVQHRANRPGRSRLLRGLRQGRGLPSHAVFLPGAEHGGWPRCGPGWAGGLDPERARAPSRQRNASSLPTGRVPVRRDVRALFRARTRRRAGSAGRGLDVNADAGAACSGRVIALESSHARGPTRCKQRVTCLRGSQSSADHAGRRPRTGDRPAAPCRRPMVTDPVVTDPVVDDPVATDPVATDPVATDPVVTDPV